MERDIELVSGASILSNWRKQRIVEGGDREGERGLFVGGKQEERKK